jgi:hypothetical protein
MLQAAGDQFVHRQTQRTAVSRLTSTAPAQSTACSSAAPLQSVSFSCLIDYDNCHECHEEWHRIRWRYAVRMTKRDIIFANRSLLPHRLSLVKIQNPCNIINFAPTKSRAHPYLAEKEHRV